MTPHERPSLESDAKANALEQLIADLKVAIKRSHLDLAEARADLDNALKGLAAAEATRNKLQERFRRATGDETCGILYTVGLMAWNQKGTKDVDLALAALEWSRSMDKSK
jgi:hypothetical protein